MLDYLVRLLMGKEGNDLGTGSCYVGHCTGWLNCINSITKCWSYSHPFLIPCYKQHMLNTIARMIILYICSCNHINNLVHNYKNDCKYECFIQLYLQLFKIWSQVHWKFHWGFASWVTHVGIAPVVFQHGSPHDAKPQRHSITEAFQIVTPGLQEGGDATAFLDVVMTSSNPSRDNTDVGLSVIELD